MQVPRPYYQKVQFNHWVRVYPDRVNNLKGFTGVDYIKGFAMYYCIFGDCPMENTRDRMMKRDNVADWFPTDEGEIIHRQTAPPCPTEPNDRGREEHVPVNVEAEADNNNTEAEDNNPSSGQQHQD
ncbi:hypothetical protein R1sor_025289 [Riccia sorocarpa]|uniref:Uncharacterized protein n=1 Tax=Riccia sorocarpa TaxID=122646 RepID=A0ABD3GBW3_9MARC